MIDRSKSRTKHEEYHAPFIYCRYGDRVIPLPRATLVHNDAVYSCIVSQLTVLKVQGYGCAAVQRYVAEGIPRCRRSTARRSGAILPVSAPGSYS